MNLDREAAHMPDAAIEACRVRIKVIGVGGAGCNAVSHMMDSGLRGVTCIAANTDVHALKRSKAECKIQLGPTCCKGMGAGCDPDKGRRAAQESLAKIRSAIGGTELVFVVAGMGGGTGTGAAPVIAGTAKASGALTIGAVTKPFFFESRRRYEIAENGIAALRQHVDNLIIIHNSRLVQFSHKKMTLNEMFKAADEALHDAVRCISHDVTRPDRVAVDFADLRAIFGNGGTSRLGTGTATGKARAREAALQALTCPLLEDMDVSQAEGILMTITASSNRGMAELVEVSEIIESAASEDCKIFFHNSSVDDSINEAMRITLIVSFPACLKEPVDDDLCRH